MNKYGFGFCSHCGFNCAVTKDGNAFRHGYIRIKKHIKRTAFKHLASGKDHNPCPGSGKKVTGWFNPTE